MTTPVSGQISFSDIRTEFEFLGSGAASMSTLRGKGNWTGSTNNTLPSGQISFSDLYGKNDYYGNYTQGSDVNYSGGFNYTDTYSPGSLDVKFIRIRCWGSGGGSGGNARHDTYGTCGTASDGSYIPMNAVGATTFTGGSGGSGGYAEMIVKFQGGTISYIRGVAGANNKPQVFATPVPTYGQTASSGSFSGATGATGNSGTSATATYTGNGTSQTVTGNGGSGGSGASISGSAACSRESSSQGGSFWGFNVSRSNGSTGSNGTGVTPSLSATVQYINTSTGGGKSANTHGQVTFNHYT
tara:strand:- start:1202 stop:2098 length:897 start_codon:yes stop_codon:yes gene_type:complete